MEESGLCCCMQPARVMRFLLRPMDNQTPGMRNYTLCVLAKSLLEYCGGSASIQQYASPCSICRDLPHSKAQTGALPTTPEGHHTKSSAHDTSDSALSSSDTSVHDEASVKYPKWRCLKQYVPLIRHENEDISTQVTQHILRLVSQGSTVFKQELFYCVFLPVIKIIKRQFGPKSYTLTIPDLDSSKNIPTTDLSENVVQYCLSALPLLLHLKSSQDMFLNYGGLNQLCQLVQVKVFRKCVLKVFQVLIMLEDKRKAKDSSKRCSMESSDHLLTSMDRTLDGTYGTDTTDSDPGVPPEPQSGINAVDAFMKLIFQTAASKPDENTMPDGTLYQRLISVTTSGEQSQNALSKVQEIQRHDSVGSTASINSPSQFEESVSTLTGSYDTDQTPKVVRSSSPYIREKLDIPHEQNELVIMCDLWNACATLLPYSQSFQQSFLEADGHNVAHNLLMNCLTLLSTNTDVTTDHAGSSDSQKSQHSGQQRKMTEAYLTEWLSLLESSLLVCLTCCNILSNTFTYHQVSGKLTLKILVLLTH